MLCLVIFFSNCRFFKIVDFSRTSTHVILQPNAQRDACLIPEFPCSPLQVPGEISRLLGEVAPFISLNFYFIFFCNFQRLHLISDPAIINVNGIQIGMVGPDVRICCFFLLIFRKQLFYLKLQFGKNIFLKDHFSDPSSSEQVDMAGAGRERFSSAVHGQNHPIGG